MGSQHKDHPEHKDKIDTFYLNKMLHLCHLLLACVALAAAAPSSKYHGHGIQCRTEYITLSTTEYEDIETKECKTKWVPVCKTYTETERSTEKRKVCEKTWEGEGDNMKWVNIPGTCKSYPHDECKDVTKEHCHKNAEKMCEDKHKRIPVKVTKKVPKKVCDEDDGYVNPLSIPDFDENEVIIEARSSKKKDSDEDSDEDSSEEKKHSDEDDD